MYLWRREKGTPLARTMLEQNSTHLLQMQTHNRNAQNPTPKSLTQNSAQFSAIPVPFLRTFTGAQLPHHEKMQQTPSSPLLCRPPRAKREELRRSLNSDFCESPTLTLISLKTLDPCSLDRFRVRILPSACSLNVIYKLVGARDLRPL